MFSEKIASIIKECAVSSVDSLHEILDNPDSEEYRELCGCDAAGNTLLHLLIESIYWLVEIDNTGIHLEQLGLAGPIRYRQDILTRLMSAHPSLLAVKNNAGELPIHRVCKRASARVIDDLIIAHSKAYIAKSDVQSFSDNLLEVPYQTEEGESLTPLLLAARYADYRTVGSLLENGASLAAVDQEGRNAALIAAAYNKFHNLEKLLTHNKALIESKDKNGRTALILKILSGEKMRVQALLKMNRGYLAIPSTDGYYPVHHAVIQGREDDFVRILTGSNGEFWDQVADDSGRTPLMLAVYFRHAKSVKFLNYANNSKCVDTQGNSVLFYAVASNDLDIVKMILNKREKDLINIKNKANVHVIDLAKKIGCNEEIINYLIEQSPLPYIETENIPLESIYPFGLSTTNEIIKTNGSYQYVKLESQITASIKQSAEEFTRFTTATQTLTIETQLQRLIENADEILQPIQISRLDEAERARILVDPRLNEYYLYMQLLLRGIVSASQCIGSGKVADNTHGMTHKLLNVLTVVSGASSAFSGPLFWIGFGVAAICRLGQIKLTFTDDKFVARIANFFILHLSLEFLIESLARKLTLAQAATLSTMPIPKEELAKTSVDKLVEWVQKNVLAKVLEVNTVRAKAETDCTSICNAIVEGKISRQASLEGFLSSTLKVVMGSGFEYQTPLSEDEITQQKKKTTSFVAAESKTSSNDSSRDGKRLERVETEVSRLRNSLNKFSSMFDNIEEEDIELADGRIVRRETERSRKNRELKVLAELKRLERMESMMQELQDKFLQVTVALELEREKRQQLEQRLEKKGDLSKSSRISSFFST